MILSVGKALPARMQVLEQCREHLPVAFHFQTRTINFSSPKCQSIYRVITPVGEALALL